MCLTRASIRLTALTRSASIRPQVGQEMMLGPSLATPLSLRIARPTRISSSSSPVIETRIVSPIPSSSSVPRPIALLIVA